MGGQSVHLKRKILIPEISTPLAIGRHTPRYIHCVIGRRSHRFGRCPHRLCCQFSLSFQNCSMWIHKCNFWLRNHHEPRGRKPGRNKYTPGERVYEGALLIPRGYLAFQPRWACKHCGWWYRTLQQRIRQRSLLGHGTTQLRQLFR